MKFVHRLWSETGPLMLAGLSDDREWSVEDSPERTKNTTLTLIAQIFQDNKAYQEVYLRAEVGCEHSVELLRENCLFWIDPFYFIEMFLIEGSESLVVEIVAHI